MGLRIKPQGHFRRYLAPWSRAMVTIAFTPAWSPVSSAGTFHEILLAQDKQCLTLAAGFGSSPTQPPIETPLAPYLHEEDVPL